MKIKIVSLITVFIISAFLLGSALYWKNSTPNQTQVKGKATKQEIFPRELALTKKEGDFNKIFFADLQKVKLEKMLSGKNSNQILPTFNPDSKSLAYFSQVNGFWVLFLYDFETQSSDFVTVTREIPKKISFSPDGKKLLYLEEDKTGTEILYLIEISTGLVEFIEKEVSELAWSPSGRNFVYVNSKVEILIGNYNQVNGLGDSQLLINSGQNPIFIREDQIIYNDLTQDKENLTIYDLNQQQKELMVEFPWENRLRLYNLNISPDQKQILFGRSINFFKGLGEVWLFDLESGQLDRILIDGFLPLWSGQNKIIYLRNNYLEDQNEVWLTDLTGVQNQLLLKGASISPSTNLSFSSSDQISDIAAFEENLGLKENLGISLDEILIDYISGDTNDDGEEESLVITFAPKDRKIHLNILSLDKRILFSNSSFLTYPLILTTENYSEDDFPSFFMIFDYDNPGFFLRWSGEEYVLTQQNL